jgi:all-trans-retinol 13,14-reductase
MVPKGPFDIILIGSGMGALTVASTMASLRGKRVLVIEKHFVAGGYTHAFKRQGFHWDVGLHYVGQMAPRSPLRRLMDRITGGSVDWTPMREPFERFRYPNLAFDLTGGRQAFLDRYSGRFPAERPALERYLSDIRSYAMGLSLAFMGKNGSVFARAAALLARPFLGSDFELTTGQYLDQHFKDPNLKALLASQWGTYGLPPSLAPFALHALIVMHYLDGAWYPAGGASGIAAAVQRIVESQGGAFLVSHEVTEVVLREGRAVGVLARQVHAGQSVEGRSDPVFVEAPVVISNTGAINTYSKLVTASADIPFRDSLTAYASSVKPVSSVCLYLGLNADPRTAGFQGENYWLYSDTDHDAVYARRGEWLESGIPPQAYVSFPSAKDPAATKHTAEVLCFTDYAPFAAWRTEPWLHRGATYDHLKEHLTAGILGFLHQHLPQLSPLIQYTELSTPLTNEFMTSHDRGAIYGLPAVSARFSPEGRQWTNPVTPIPGLYLTGSDVSTFGIAGAMMGGVTTLSVIPDSIPTPALFR